MSLACLNKEDTTPTIIGAATNTIKSLSNGGGANFKRERYEWEIDPSKLIIYDYDGQDVTVSVYDSLEKECT
ncbi:Protein kinase superfamily protein [Senna tora]|uniref:Protein kinase superfamily protein n=1 Tax=Senna tora TaxID=362788 RepID=A0A834TQM3_9FABA|nr:Protein kinase superfamily protein [Senna tora]